MIIQALIICRSFIIKVIIFLLIHVDRSFLPVIHNEMSERTMKSEELSHRINGFSLIKLKNFTDPIRSREKERKSETC